MKRLFLFAAYNKGQEISQTLIDYLNFVSKLGDIVLCFDSDVSKTELRKLSNISNILHVFAERHGEYDFGSYKRAYQWAEHNKLLSKYDYIYLVNDSVYCLRLSEYLLQNIESTKDDLIGMVKYADCQTPEHMQSWFMGISKKVATADFMSEFMGNITKQNSKINIVLKYEIMFSRIIINHGFKMSAIIGKAHDTTTVYKKPYVVLNEGVPFVKKKSIQYIVDINRLNLYADSVDVVNNIKTDVIKNGIKIKPNKYACVYKLSVFGVPVFKKLMSHDTKATKGFIFGIPVYKTVDEK